MDTIIRLKSSKRQMAFIGEITKKRLKEIILFPQEVVIHVVQKVLGKDYIYNEDRTRANNDIAAMFIAVALQFDRNKDHIERLSRNIFNPSILVDLNRVLLNIDEDLTIPRPKHYDILIKNSCPVPRYPILCVGEIGNFEARREEIGRNLEFLLWLMQVTPPNRGLVRDISRKRGDRYQC